jgi:hypothetical protein
MLIERSFTQSSAVAYMEWHFFDFVKVQEVLFRQQTLKMLTGEEREKQRKVLDLQARITALGSRFDQNRIELDELPQGLS